MTKIELLSEIDEALKNAPNAEPPEVAILRGSPYEVKHRRDWKKNGGRLSKAKRDIGVVEFHPTPDMTYKILNCKKSLEAFRKRVKRSYPK